MMERDIKDIGSPTSPAASGASATASLSLEGLLALVQAVEPAAVLVSSRVLRRVIRYQEDLPRLRWSVPHRRSYFTDREALLQEVELDELGLPAGVSLPDRVLLLERPSQEELDFGDAGDTLTAMWRLLFHCRVHQALEERLAADAEPQAALLARIDKLGFVVFDEIRNVLDRDGFLFRPQDDRAVYVEFAAVWLELRYFAPSLLPHCFPSLDDTLAVQALLGGDLDAESLLRTARPQGAPKPADRFEGSEVDELVSSSESQDDLPLPSRPQASESAYRRLMLKADRVARTGNEVRAAICCVRAAQAAPRKLTGKARTAARRHLARLVRRMQAALEVASPDPQPWEELLAALLRQTTRGMWTVEARLMYDLQKVCVDAEREVFTVDPVEWALSFGRRPMRRSLPSQRDVLMAKHLRSAMGRLTAVRLTPVERQHLSALVRDALERAEQRIRDHFRPRINAVLDQVGLVPLNLPERVARRKLIEELLDGVVEHGFLSMSDLRDGLSRNNLKLPDTRRPGELVWGDPLLRADRGLAVALDGVHRRGEFYLRWMQKLSSLAFGTPVGRFLTRFAAVPFGGAFLILTFVRHSIEKLLDIEWPLDDTLNVVLLGSFLVGLIHHAGFRRLAWQGVKTGWRVAKALLFDLPRWMLRWPWVRWVLGSRVMHWAWRLAVKPALVVAVAVLLLPRSWTAEIRDGWHLAAALLGASLLLNSRIGRNAEDALGDLLAVLWHRVGLRFLAGLFHLVVDAFRTVLENTERLLYTVDEWLRFRSGDSRWSIRVKAVLGTLWFVVAYVVRFCITLLIEPQFNPIKHFPVVTVSHKLLLPLIPAFANVLSYTLETGLAYTVAGTIIFCIPGIFGFLVWELKENWRLYAANRTPNLEPVSIGHHGENLGRLLKPGFHSGTLPKRFAKLRRAERKAREKGTWSAVRRHLRALQHLELALRRYVERELLALLEECPAWKEESPAVREVHAATNRVRVSIGLQTPGATPLELRFEMKSGWLLASMPQPGWVDDLAPAQRRIFSSALLGLYKSGGVDLVRSQLETKFPPPTPPYDLTADRLVVWSDARFTRSASYDLGQPTTLVPQPSGGSDARAWPTLERDRVVFAAVALNWLDWIAAWQMTSDASGEPRLRLAGELD